MKQEIEKLLVSCLVGVTFLLSLHEELLGQARILDTATGEPPVQELAGAPFRETRTGVASAKTPNTLISKSALTDSCSTITSQVSVHYSTSKDTSVALSNGFRLAGRHLGRCRPLWYASNLLGYACLLPAAWTTEEKTEQYWWGTMTTTTTKPSALGWGLFGLSFASSIAANQAVGRAGETLLETSTLFPPEKGYPLAQAGQRLREYRNLRNLGEVLYTGGLLLTLGRSTTTGMVVASGGALAALFSVPRAAQAGAALQEASKTVPQLEAERLLYEAGTDLKSFSSRQWAAMAVGLVGSGTLLLGISEEEESLQATGAIAILAGHILGTWVAPWKLGSAGKKLQGAGKLLASGQGS